MEVGIHCNPGTLNHEPYGRTISLSVAFFGILRRIFFFPCRVGFIDKGLGFRV